MKRPARNPVRAALARKAMTQMAAAQSANVSLPTVWRAVNSGKWPAQQRTRLALQRALGVEPKGVGK